MGTADAAVPTLQARALGVAKYQIGDPYVWGATGPNSFDCSGLVYYSYRRASNGKTLPRTAQAQYNKAKKIVSTSRRAGDLIFFGTSATNIVHAAFYIGNGNMLDADSGSYYGHQVTKEPVNGWFSQHYHVYYGRI